MNFTFEFLQPDPDITKRSDSDLQLLNKCKRITLERIKDVTTEEELTKLRDEARDRAERLWTSFCIIGDAHRHRLWIEEDIVWKLLTDCIHKAFPPS